MAARRPFWKWQRWKSTVFCLWPPSTCIWNLKLKFQSKLDLCSGNHVVYRQTDGRTDRRTDGRTRWIQYTPPPTSLGGGIMMGSLLMHTCITRPQWVKAEMAQESWNHFSWKTRAHLWFILQSKIHGCWWPGDAGSQVISRQGIYWLTAKSLI